MLSSTKAIRSSALFPYRNGIGPVVSTALFLVIAIVSVVSFQTWFNSFSSSTFSGIESSSIDEAFTIQEILGGTLYIKNNGNSELSIKTLKIGDVDCEISANLSVGINSIDVSVCLSQLSSKNQDIVVYTDSLVTSKNLFIRDLDENAPYLSFSSNWTTIPYNTSINLSWSGNNLLSCIGVGNWSGSKGVFGSEVISNLTSNTSYSLTCSSNSGNISDSVDIVVSDLPIITFNASESSLSYNSSTNLSWSVINADSCIGSGNWSGSKGTSGIYNTSNLSSGTYIYNLICIGFGGSSEASVEVNVSPAPTEVLIDFNTTNYNLSANLIANYSWDGVTPLDVEVTIASGVIIGSTSTSNPAFTTGDLSLGSTVLIKNEGQIIGRGGNGGIAHSVYDNTNSRGSTTGGSGGAALDVNVNVSINNTGLIAGGGGGGGGSPYNTANSGCWGSGAGFVGGAGGGGAGYVAGSGGAGGIPQWTGGCCSPASSSAGSAGSLLTGGSGSSSPTSCGWPGGGPGGAGGNLGEAGSAGSASAGSAGYSIVTNGNSITWITGNSSTYLKGPIN